MAYVGENIFIPTFISKFLGDVTLNLKSFLESSYLLIKYLCINSAVLHYISRSHGEYAQLLDMTSFQSGGFL